jgi:hypothetical protein
MFLIINCYLLTFLHVLLILKSFLRSEMIYKLCVYHDDDDNFLATVQIKTEC